MSKSPTPYTPDWCRLPRPYAEAVASALDKNGVPVSAWWDDPIDPRDATILLAGGDALVWDERSGWRRGRYVSGERGVRTVLASEAYLGLGVLPPPEEVVAGLHTSAERVDYRDFRDHGDGLDARLAEYAAVLVA